MPTSSPRLLQPDDLEPLETSDGSMTWRRRGDGMTYRSVFGAESEAEQTFLRGTRLDRQPGPWRVLELGFGAATSFRVTAQAALDAQVELHYTSVDHQLIPSQILTGEDVPTRMARDALRALRGGQQAVVELQQGPLRLTLHRGRWLQAALGEMEVDALFFDPFGPEEQPDSWTLACFERAASHMHDRAILATYSIAVAPRDAMARAGLHVAAGPGPGRKRAITFAARSLEVLQGYTIQERFVHGEGKAW